MCLTVYLMNVPSILITPPPTPPSYCRLSRTIQWQAGGGASGSRPGIPRPQHRRSQGAPFQPHSSTPTLTAPAPAPPSTSAHADDMQKMFETVVAKAFNSFVASNPNRREEVRAGSSRLTAVSIARHLVSCCWCLCIAQLWGGRYCRLLQYYAPEHLLFLSSPILGYTTTFVKWVKKRQGIAALEGTTYCVFCV